MAPPLVAIVCYPGIQPLDVVGPHEVFAAADRLVRGAGGAPAYDVRLVAAVPGPIRGESGLALIAPEPLPDPPTVDTLVLPGGDGVQAAAADDALVAYVQAVAPHARRVASVCSGTFVLAAAGLLTGRTVTTHWRRAAQLASAYPDVIVDPDPIHRRDGNIWTSAGVTAGIDLALAMVEEDHGAEVAQRIARHLVMFLRRPGGQSQFATPVWSPPASHDAIRAAQDAVHAAPGEDHRVEPLARRVGMSPRHFTRRFQEQVGESPARYVERIRVECARAMLQRDDAGVRVIAERCGFGTAETMRRAFLRRLGVPPDDYRKRFR